MTTLGERLASARDRLGMTQKAAAEQLGISNVVLSRYESNERRPDPETLRHIAETYATSTDYLLGLTDDPAPATSRGDTVNTVAAHRTDDPMADLPEPARKSLNEFIAHIRQKYSKKDN